MLKKTTFSVLTILFLFSCKKDNLKAMVQPKEIAVGPVHNDSTKATTVPDPWNGTYHFEASNRDQIKTSYDITINSLNDISIQINDDGDKVSYSHIKAEVLNDDNIKLAFDPSLEDEMGIIYIEKSDDTYLISGYPIYFINLGNNEMPLIKEK
ncbi:MULTISPECIES: hypothetical protein [Chryseobacterium]|uniref:hypothetical protein n=1 Tax=Chryseobacterium TaxID=59732 RepID=UPI0016258E51|nr:MULTISPECIES: hypothetical protein [Chryseobacterium]MDM1556373.1 hypothetical protein [Chryseobacterium indologenes]